MALYINEDHFYPEIIDPVTLESLPYGTQGELVFTTVDQRGHAVVALPYEGPDFADCRCVSVRSYQCAYDADYGPKR